MTQLEQYIKSYFGISDAHLNAISKMFKEERIEKNEFVKNGGTKKKSQDEVL